MGNDRGWSKRWWCQWVGRRDRQTPLDGVIEVVGGGRNLVSPSDEIEVVVVGVEESRWRRLMVVDAGVDGEGGRMMGVVAVDDGGDRERRR